MYLQVLLCMRRIHSMKIHSTKRPQTGMKKARDYSYFNCTWKEVSRCLLLKTPLICKMFLVLLHYIMQVYQSVFLVICKAHRGHLGVVKMLLEFGADPSIEDNFGYFAYQLASNRNFKECADLLQIVTMQKLHKIAQNTQQDSMS